MFLSQLPIVTTACLRTRIHLSPWISRYRSTTCSRGWSSMFHLWFVRKVWSHPILPTQGCFSAPGAGELLSHCSQLVTKKSEISWITGGAVEGRQRLAFASCSGTRGRPCCTFLTRMVLLLPGRPLSALYFWSCKHPNHKIPIACTTPLPSYRPASGWEEVMWRPDLTRRRRFCPWQWDFFQWNWPLQN